jgi:hypothetical protein
MIASNSGGEQIILNGIANVLHRFLLGFSLRPTTGKRGWTPRVAFGLFLGRPSLMCDTVVLAVQTGGR